MQLAEAKDYINSHPKEYLRAQHGIVIKGRENSKCPVCGGSERSGKFSIRDDNKLHCFACGFHGDVLDLIAQDHGLDVKRAFRDVVKAGCEIFGLSLEEVAGKKDTYHSGSRKAAAHNTAAEPRELVLKEPYDFTAIIRKAQEHIAETTYFHDRGFSDELIERYCLGYSPKGYNALLEGFPELQTKAWQQKHYQYVIPILNADNTCRYFLVRATSELKEDKYNKKVRNMKNPEGRNPVKLFNERYLTEYKSYGSDPVFLVEGWADALSVEEAGFRAVALNSVSNVRKVVELCRHYRPKVPFVVALDQDKRGQQASKMLTSEMREAGFSVMAGNLAGSFKDANEFFLQDRDGFQRAVAEAATQSGNEPVLSDRCEITEFTNAPMQLRAGKWTGDETGVYTWVPGKKQGDPPIRINASCQQIMPTGIIENIETGEQKYVLSFSVKREQRYVWKDIKVEPAVCCSKTKIVALSNVGVRVTDQSSKYLVSYIDDMFTLNEDIIPVRKSISRLGWIGKEFTPYAGGIVFDGDNEQERIAQSIRPAGNFSLWSEECKIYRRNLLVRLLMDAGLASVLIGKLGGLCFVLHLWGASGHGKTVALNLIASLWGDPKEILSSAAATMNFCTNRAAFFKSLPVLIDETQLAGSTKDGMLDKLIYAMTEGREKGRLNRDSRERSSKTWECVSVFTGEKPIVGSRSGAGAINRVLELEIEGPLFQNFSQVMDVATTNYGHAGKLFVEHIQEIGLEGLQKQYRELCAELAGKIDSTGKQIQSLAFIMLADRLAEEDIFPGEKPLELDEVAGFLKKEQEISDPERAYSFIVNWIGENQNYFTEESQKVYGRIKDGYCFINKNVLTRTLEENQYNFDAVKKSWATKGYIEKNTEGRYHHNRKEGNITVMYVKLNFSNFEDVMQGELPFKSVG